MKQGKGAQVVKSARGFLVEWAYNATPKYAHPDAQVIIIEMNGRTERDFDSNGIVIGSRPSA